MIELDREMDRYIDTSIHIVVVSRVGEITRADKGQDRESQRPEKVIYLSHMRNVVVAAALRSVLLIR